MEYDKLDLPTYNVSTVKGYRTATNELKAGRAVLIKGSEKGRAKFQRDVVQRVTAGYSDVGYIDVMT